MYQFLGRSAQKLMRRVGAKAMSKIPENAQGRRLDRHLTETYPEYSRAYWQKEIKAGRVLIDGKSVTPHYAVEAGDTLTIVQPPKQSPISPPPLSIIAETDEYLVLDKPSGLLVHKTQTSNEPTLARALVARYPAIAGVGDDPDRPGIVHRLDREASGVMVIAKIQAVFEHLKHQFASRKVKKTYTALVHGVLSKDADEIKLGIARSEQGGRMAARPTSQEGREAITRYEVVKRFPHHTLVHAFPLTGRTHQIRAHFHALGHPIVGDRLYRTKTQKKKNRGQRTENRAEPRLMLHATKLSFSDLRGDTQTFSSPLPPKFEDYLNALS